MPPSPSRRDLLAVCSGGLAVGSAGCLDDIRGVVDPSRTRTHRPTADLRLTLERPGDAEERVLVHNDGDEIVQLRSYTLDYDGRGTYQLDTIPLEPGGVVEVKTTGDVDGVKGGSPRQFLRGANFDEPLCPDGAVTLHGPQGMVVTRVDCAQATETGR
ncbi:lamin tail domain-containing protein [Haloarchaeobius sp. HME9146]|uniref:lamin tail domain-containing protein n=1 Tax=Haloarchaeobius sp. HME9146 TaxID=2978732 RepID=UPI0021BE0C01|nr:lamin tail domain-containing protein [Haloarchaeobius sp. HME9146]MCT9095624.1 lamin tail domain-containing protein [Haloarchaeobius sp. HME9146]